MNQDFNIDHAQRFPVTADNSRLTPVALAERIDLMDLLRGFALIGILLMNIEWFNRPLSELPRFDQNLTGLDHAISFLVKVVVEGKFYKLFSLLFGMGFAVMLLRAQEKGSPFGAWFVRRMLVLYALGVAHMVFLWGGDILHDYALTGLLLLGLVLLLRTRRLQRFNQPRTFQRLGLLLLAMPFLGSLAVGGFFGLTRDSQTLGERWRESQEAQVLYQQGRTDALQLAAMQAKLEQEENAAEEDSKEEAEPTREQRIQASAEQRLKKHVELRGEIEAETAAFTQDSYWQACQYRLKVTLEALPNTLKFGPIVVLPLFMLGYWLIASGAVRHAREHQRLFKALAWLGLGLGLPLSLGGHTLVLHPAHEEIIEMNIIGHLMAFLGEYLMCAGYLGLVALLAQQAKVKRWLAWLAPLGRMALTNYLCHSLLLSLVFYGYGLSLFGAITRGPQMLLAAVIILTQTLLSHYWLKHFRFGPMEWLWRSLTYWRLQPMRLG